MRTLEAKTTHVPDLHPDLSARLSGILTSSRRTRLGAKDTDLGHVHCARRGHIGELSLETVEETNEFFAGLRYATRDSNPRPSAPEADALSS